MPQGTGFLGFETDTENHRRLMQEAAAFNKLLPKRTAVPGSSQPQPKSVYAQTVTGAADPLADPSVWAGDRLREAGVNPSIANYQKYQDALAALTRSKMADPYSSTASRGAQTAALDQMRGRLPQSAVAMRGDIAQDQGLMTALRAPSRGTMSAAAAGMSGMASDVANARAQEYMAALGGLNQGVSALRGADMQAGQDQFQSALSAQRLTNNRGIAGATVGSQLEMARQRALVEQARMYDELKLQRQSMNTDTAKTAASVGAQVLKMLLGV